VFVEGGWLIDYVPGSGLTVYCEGVCDCNSPLHHRSRGDSNNAGVFVQSLIHYAIPNAIDPTYCLNRTSTTLERRSIPMHLPFEPHA
jgi:hypothetical protein